MSRIPAHIERIAWDVDTLIQVPVNLATFREWLEQFARNAEADGQNSRWSHSAKRRLDLADRAALLAAIHDTVCGSQSSEIMPPEWWPKRKKKPPYAIRYAALAGFTTDRWSGAQLNSFLGQVRGALAEANAEVGRKGREVPDGRFDQAEEKKEPSPSRTRARAVYEYALGEVPGASDMSVAELFKVAKDHLESKMAKAEGPEAEKLGEFLGHLPANAETFARYLRDAGVKRYDKAGKPRPTRSIRRRADLA